MPDQPADPNAGADDDRARDEEASRPLTHRSEDLLGGRSEAWIEHRGELYRLRLTSAGKLYLTK
jgi:hemin uptake protein HemP